MAVTPSRIEIIEGGSAVLSARVSPEAASDRAVAWSSSDRSVATVDKSGTVHGLRPGTATVTATAEGKSGTCAVTVKAKAVNVTEVTLDKTELTLTEGETGTLTATVKPDNADNKKVTWSSDKTEVATVDGAGRVTAVKAGEAVVTVTTEDGGKTATCRVTVKAKAVNVTEVTLDKTELTLTEGETETLTATVKPDNADNRKVTWSSDKTEVATVDGDGRVTAVKAGVAVVTVTTEDGGKTATCKVTVKAKTVNVTEVTLDRTELTLTEGETETLTATVKPDNADNKKVKWSSDKTEVATVGGDGRVTAVKAGEAVVTVTTEDGGKTATCKVTVRAKAVGVTDVTLDKTELTLTEGETETLTATVKPDNADNRKVTWSSDKTEIATVDGAGRVTAVKAGVAVVTVTTEDGGKTATCKVTVKAKAVPVTGVSLDRTELTLTEGETETLTATVRPDNADNRKVTWNSDKTEVATVDGAGKVTAVKPGEAVVTVTTEDGGKTASCKVTVKAKVVPVTGVDVKPWSVTIGANGTTKLTCTVAPSNATNRNVRWESDSPSVATVDSDGNVRAVSAGVAKVSAVTEDGGFRSGCTVTVKEFSSGFEVGGLFYKTAEGYSMDFVEVTGNQGGGKYSGDVVVPGTVEYDGITYTVKGVGNRAFEGCGALRKVTISEGIYKIGAYAFCYCGNLERVILPSTLEKIDGSNPVFTGCSKLEIITTAPREGQEDYYYLHDGALYVHMDRMKREILSWIPEKKTGTVVIKEGTTKIADYSIYLTNVDKIVIPESVKSIDINTFVSCKTPLVLELNWKTKEDVDEITTSAPSSFFFNGTDRSAVKVTVPKGTKSYYESHWLWSNLGGIEERP